MSASGRYVYTHRAHLVKAARDLGHTVIVVAPGAEQYFTPPHDNLVLDRANTNPLKELSTLWRIILLYRRYQPDIVHHVGLKPSLLGGLAAYVCRVPRVIHAVSGVGAALDHGIICFVIRFVMRLFWRNAIVLVQNEVDEAFVQGFAKRIIRLPGAGVDLQTFCPSDHKSTSPSFVVTLASRMLWTKGVGLFVEAVRQLKEQGIPVEGWLVGGVDGVNPHAIPEEQLKQWGDTVTWLGERDDVASLYQKSHVVVLPTSYREGVPKALIEAAACGCPILTTNRPGCNQVVMDGKNGFFVESVDDIVVRIRQLYENSSLRESMGEASREHAKKTFDERYVTQTTIEVYNEN